MKYNKEILFSVTAALYIAILVFHQEAKEGLIAAFGNCVNNVLPSVFPALLLTSCMTDAGLPDILKKTAGRFFSEIFGVSSGCAEIIIYGLIAGYPAGMKTAVKCSENRTCSQEEIRRTALTATNPGIAFTVLSLNKQTGSTKIGVLLYLSVTAAQILSAQFIRKKINKKRTEPYSRESKANSAMILTNAVSGAANACISMTAWITAFGAISQLTSIIPLQGFRSVFLPISEVTQATREYLYTKNYPLAAFSLGFGGICIFFQLLPDMLELGISPLRFLAFRTACGLFSAGIMQCLSRLIPASITVSVWTENTTFPIRTGPGVFSLFFFCVIFMFGLANKFSLC